MFPHFRKEERSYYPAGLMAAYTSMEYAPEIREGYELVCDYKYCPVNPRTWLADTPEEAERRWDAMDDFRVEGGSFAHVIYAAWDLGKGNINRDKFSEVYEKYCEKHDKHDKHNKETNGTGRDGEPHEKDG